jgi:hypothetical protein
LFLLLVKLFNQLSRILMVFDPRCIKSFVLDFDRRIGPESLAVEF